MTNEWIHGRNAVYEVLRAGRRKVKLVQIARGIKQSGRIPDILSLCQTRNYPLSWVPRSILAARGSGHQGVAVQAGAYPYANLHDILLAIEQVDRRPMVLILDMIQDPQNLGTLLRTAEAVGVVGVLLPLRRAALVSAAVTQASSGATEHLCIARANLARAMVALKQAGLWMIGLEGERESTPLGDVRLDGPVGLVVGNEGQGMRRLVRESCDVIMSLPMRGNIESLNAAVAGSIALYFAWQGDGFQGVERSG